MAGWDISDIKNGVEEVGEDPYDKHRRKNQNFDDPNDPDDSQKDKTFEKSLNYINVTVTTDKRTTWYDSINNQINLLTNCTSEVNTCAEFYDPSTFRLYTVGLNCKNDNSWF